MSGIPHANEMSTDENEYEQKESLLNTSIVSTQSTSKLPRFVYALLSLSILLNVILLASSWFGTNHVAQSSYENGFASDLNSVKSEINLIQKTFSGGIELNGEAGFFTNQDENRYTGPPSSQVDEAWDELLVEH
ncbi:hypothetical protein B0O99DRAFT_696138 [Bisporella sp. PMI_857]|nr:hypothetical protein B0O99DRAFT_696138 [Bisporella sp. PMI_857]